MKFVTTFFLLLFSVAVNAQDVSGLWRGRFTSSHPLQLSSNYKYELLLFQEGNKLTGYSYSTLLDGNFYAVCEIKGNLFEGYMVVTETKTIYENPPGDNNNFQTHILFFNADGKEATGDWKQANKRPTQLFEEEGKTFLKKEQDPSKSGLLKILEQKNAVVIAPSVPTQQTAPVEETKFNTDSLKLSARPLNILQTISITADSISIELYDDGLIDGDSVSVFSNSSVLLSKVALTDKGLKQRIAAPLQKEELLISLYAENQGTIPPNTGVLIIRADDRRYEIRFTSDTKQSAAVRIKRQ
ncbi:hypothetical protein ESA94_09595 [Lacibacter luteus]|uniref:DUF4488 domain-containing protein n=1 Tax=Lacibacter luteus TaxID=2508719 RepID=A0A4Q1CJ78_9BACT|nr:hypothetical protein [Lacibacter luteus]RXK60706.1 hypothetical protein ESA94_09595 [Lacibacter luteus]